MKEEKNDSNLFMRVRTGDDSNIVPGIKIVECVKNENVKMISNATKVEGVKFVEGVKYFKDGEYRSLESIINA